MRTILAHDLGTTGDKATLFDLDGGIVASAFAGYGTHYNRPHWAEQDPADWREALFAATRQLLATSGVDAAGIASISFSGHMNGALMVDARGVPLRPHLLWADQRATVQARRIRDRCGDAETYRLTGNRISPAYTAAKVLWIKDNEPEVFQQTHRVLQAKDYAAFLLSGVMATDFSDASLTQLFDLERRRWSDEILDRLEIPPDLLPAIHPSAAVIGAVTKEAARQTGLAPGTPVVIGGGDGGCATVGAGSVSPGDAYNYIGSSSWLALSSQQPLLDPRQRTFNFVHLDPILTVALGTMQTAGGAFDWFERLLRDEAVTEPQYRDLDRMASVVPAGSSGLLFLPYLLGERSPHWNPLARGAFIGLTMAHDRGDLVRAVMEGVAFNLRSILDVLTSQGVSIAAIRLIGGAGKSSLWRQILAAVYGLPVHQLGLPAQATALGAAIAGGVAIGAYPDYGIARSLAPVATIDEPDPVSRERYASLYPLFQEAYRALEPLFPRLAALGQ